jgi:hypothetical protein
MIREFMCTDRLRLPVHARVFAKGWSPHRRCGGWVCLSLTGRTPRQLPAGGQTMYLEREVLLANVALHRQADVRPECEVER